MKTEEPADSRDQAAVPPAGERAEPGASGAGDASAPSGRVRTYRIVLETDGDGRHVVTCPGLDGVITDGATEEEAVLNAHEAARAMLESCGKDGEFVLVSGSS